MSALSNLIAAVEAGRDNSKLWYPALGENGYMAMMAFHGCINSASGLAHAVLPEWLWSIGHPTRTKRVYAYMTHATFGRVVEYQAQADDPARALLLVTLKTMEQTTNETGLCLKSAKQDAAE